MSRGIREYVWESLGTPLVTLDDGFIVDHLMTKLSAWLSCRFSDLGLMTPGLE